MLGLVSLQHTLNPHSTLEKAIFLIDNAATHAHALTAIISFSALAILVTLRKAKGIFKNYWWIYRLPEVLLVVVISTSTFSASMTVIPTADRRHSAVGRVRLGVGWRRYPGVRTDQHRRILHSSTDS